MIGRNGERRSGISAQAARHDDDDNDINIITTKTYRPVFFYYLRERSLAAWWVCDSVKFWTPLPAVASLALNYSLT